MRPRPQPCYSQRSHMTHAKIWGDPHHLWCWGRRGSGRQPREGLWVTGGGRGGGACGVGVPPWGEGPRVAAWSEGLGESGPGRATWKAGELGGIWGPAGSNPSTSTSSWAGGPGCSPQHRAGGKLEKPGKGRKPQKAHYRPAATGLSPSGDLAEPAALWSRKPMCPQLPGHSPTCLRGCPSLSLSYQPGRDP